MDRPVKAELDEKGREIPDSVPLAPPVGYKREPSMTERIRNMVRSEHLRIAAERAGAETFEEADDFEVGDDFDPSSPYEEVFDPVDYEARNRLRDDEWRAKVEARLEEFKPLKPEDANAGNDKGRAEPDNSRSGGSDKVVKGDAKSVNNPSNDGSD